MRVRNQRNKEDRRQTRLDEEGMDETKRKGRGWEEHVRKINRAQAKCRQTRSQKQMMGKTKKCP